MADISWIFKVRGDLLYLNNKPYLRGNNNECTMRENAFHFLAVCPVLKEFRVEYLRQIGRPSYIIAKMLGHFIEANVSI